MKKNSKHSKSLKADKELMWKKLSTLPRPLGWPWTQMVGRGLREGFKPGEITIIASGRRNGKSMLQQKYLEALADEVS